MRNYSTIYEEISMHKISISEHNVRKNLEAGSEDSNIEDLAKSINEQGLLNPITVVKRKSAYELIAGQRRFLACQLLGWKIIPALIRSDVNDMDAKVISLIENVHRSDLHPLDKGRAYKEIYQVYGTYSRVSKETGVSIPTVKRYMLLLNLAPSIQELLTTRDGPAGVCTLSMLAHVFPKFDEQEYVLERIGRFGYKVQLEILKRSGGDINKIEELVEMALGGCFGIEVCKGLEGCPHIPVECKEEVLAIIKSHKLSSELWLNP